MDTNHSTWRRLSRVVAVMNLIFVGYDVVLTGLTGQFLIYATQTHIGAITHLFIPWTLTTFFFGHTVVDIWATRKLFLATKSGDSVTEVIKMARACRLATIILVVLTIIIRILVLSQYVGAAVYVSLRCIFIVVVHEFIQELEKIANVPDNGTPCSDSTVF